MTDDNYPEWDQVANEFEAELADVVDPGPLQFNNNVSHNGTVVFEHIAPACAAIIEDIVMAMNDGRPAIVQYLQSDGTAVTCMLTSPRTLHIMVEHAEDRRWVVAHQEDD